MPKGYLLLILHAHLPYVRHPEYERFLEERWFFEALVETYVPLIKFFDQLRSESIPFKLTVSISPTLANMMEDSLLRRAHGPASRYAGHAGRARVRADQGLGRRQLPEPDVPSALCRGPLGLCGALRHPSDQGLPGVRQRWLSGDHHLCRDARLLAVAVVRADRCSAQIQAAVKEHERLFGKKPCGMWLPECAFYPGLDQLLAEAGIRYFMVDAHGIEYADPKPIFGVHAPLYTPTGVAAFGRNPSTSRLVWSSRIGYPADFNYREYYRDIGYDLDQAYLEPFQYAPGVKTQTGIKYYRITGSTQDKTLYNPDWARDTVEQHARDFVGRCRDQSARVGHRMPFPPVIVSPYDAELFGHWWFEGPQWIYRVIREISYQNDLALSTPGEYLQEHPIQQKAMPCPSSWGRNGYHDHWVNAKTDWMWRPLHEAAVRMTLAVQKSPPQIKGSLPDRTLRQAGRELLLAQASDWPFIITNGTTEEYARRRFQDHLNRFHDLLQDFDKQELDQAKLESLEYMDAIFPELDYRLFAPGN